MKKKRQQNKRRSTSNRSTKIMTKNFEIFVTDFLLDPCGLPLELKDCVLVDGSMPINENGGKDRGSVFFCKYVILKLTMS